MEIKIRNQCKLYSLIQEDTLRYQCLRQQELTLVKFSIYYASDGKTSLTAFFSFFSLSLTQLNIQMLTGQTHA